ncbi:unnamed protein product, partial [Sphagnum balticum]
RQIIKSAMTEIMRETCAYTDSSYVQLAPIDGCWAVVGRIGGSLSVDKSCISRGVVMHELLHTIGFFHEQSRSDRDRYVIIYWKNIDDDDANQFTKMSLSETNVLSTEYDYDSIMHYGQYAFTKNG